jgi:Na+/H+ antiporter NhaA
VTRILIGGLLVVLGLGGVYFGVIGWTTEREVMDTSVLDVTFSERETSPMVAAVGGMALALGIVMMYRGRDRGAG